MTSTALIDGDIVAYRAAASAEDDDVDVALMRVDSRMMRILENEDTYKVFLSGKNNFRKEINPEYKANRKDKIRPQWLSMCQTYLVDEYHAEFTDGYEADDALGFCQTEDSMIYTIDKDLLMIPGHHYNFINKVYREVGHLEGLKLFYKQMLIGDSVDNIMGVRKIGKVKAAKLIDHLEHEELMFKVVMDLYEGDEDRFWMNADCLWIWQTKGERFTDRDETKQIVKGEA